MNYLFLKFGVGLSLSAAWQPGFSQVEDTELRQQEACRKSTPLITMIRIQIEPIRTPPFVFISGSDRPQSFHRTYLVPRNGSGFFIQFQLKSDWREIE